MIQLQELRDILADAAEAMTTPTRVTPKTAEAYYGHLSDLSVGLLKAAVDYCIEENSAFFPSIDAIRKAAKTLIGLSLGIPSPAEAWAIVQTAKNFVGAVYCEESLRMRTGLQKYVGGEYLLHIREWAIHCDTCEKCKDAHDEYTYGHPVVANTVRQLGGWDVIHTDNPTADRARWIEAYREIVERELRMATLSPAVKGFIGDSREKLLVDSSVSTLVKRLSSPQILESRR